MKIEIITTPNEKLKETGFGSLKACNDVLEVLQKSYKVKLNVCKDTNDLENIICNLFSLKESVRGIIPQNNFPEGIQ